MPSITVAYTGSRDPLSTLARLVTGNAKWSHCGIVVGDYVIEARLYYGVVGTPINEWKKRCPHFEMVDVECANPDAAHAFAREQVGKGYDYAGAFSVPFRTHWQHPSHWYCSELVEAALYAGGRNRWRDTKQAISPQESWDVV
jgi:uncharacterized protein YycO